jgi:hypothetical protein
MYTRLKSIFQKLRGNFHPAEPTDESPSSPDTIKLPPEEMPAPVSIEQAQVKKPPIALTPQQEAETYLSKENEKVAALVNSFAEGHINRTQFQELYAHYQNKIQQVISLIETSPGTDQWKSAAQEGSTVIIKRKLIAQVLGFSIYDNESGMPLKSLGTFTVDPALFVPMLSAYRSATREIFGAGVKSTQIEGGQWLVFIPGTMTTTLALFSHEPSQRQIKRLEDVHHAFEVANDTMLKVTPVVNERLVFPHEFFIKNQI